MDLIHYEVSIRVDLTWYGGFPAKGGLVRTAFDQNHRHGSCIQKLENRLRCVS